MFQWLILGGGCIIFGVKNDGTQSEYDITSVLNLDSAIITDKVAKYTNEQFSEFEIEELERDGNKVAILIVHGVSIPMIFIRPGTYSIGGNRQQTAFGKGTIYFRHGAKSEPGTSDDLRKVIAKEVEEIRKSWLGNIRKVVKAPTGHVVQVLPSDVRISPEPGATPIRITKDEEAPAYRLMTPDVTHPHRQKDVIEIVNERLKGRKKINQYDVLCVRNVYNIDDTKPDFYYKSKYGAPQYSNEFVEWLVQFYEKNPSFFDAAREKYRRLRDEV